jgi:hypothetical protein
MTKDKIEAYFAARELLLNSFDVEYPDYIEDKTSNEWMLDEDSLNYLDDDDEYNFESANLIGESQGYQLFHVLDNGKEYYALFHSDKQLTDEDEIDEKFDL